MDKYDIKSDLMIEAVDLSEKNEGIVSNIKHINNITITDVIVNNENLIKKKKGKYITIEFNNIDDEKDIIRNAFIKSLNNLMKINNISLNNSLLVVVLGNEKSTPDSLGPSVIDNIVVTRHLEELGFNCGPIVSAIKPGVTGETGIETKDIITGIVSVIRPDYLIVIDSLSSTSISRLNKTIQMTDTGIHPGSGVGNKRCELSKDTIGVPVIAIGVPTVCDAVTIVNDTIDKIHNHFAITTENVNNPTFKLMPINEINKFKAKPLDKVRIKELSGLIGMLDTDDRKKLIKEIIDKTEYNLMVTPKEIDFIIDKLSDLISIGINETMNYKP